MRGMTRGRTLLQYAASFLLFASLFVSVFAGTFFILYEAGFVPRSIAQIGEPALQAPIVPRVMASFKDYGENAAYLTGRTASLLGSFYLPAVEMPSISFSRPSFKIPAINWTTMVSFPGFLRSNFASAVTESSAVDPLILKTSEMEGLTIRTPSGSATLIIPSVELTADIVFPPSADIDILEAALKKGVVHFPYSALPGETGNVFIFGHSTVLPVPESSSYRAFNDIKKLTTGDKIDIKYSGVVYEYRVTGMRIGDAEDVIVDFKPGKSLLTLTTCWFRGENWENKRYVVEAEFVRSYLPEERSTASSIDTSS